MELDLLDEHVSRQDPVGLRLSQKQRIETQRKDFQRLRTTPFIAAGEVIQK
jgi:hypothetical protein